MDTDDILLLTTGIVVCHHLLRYTNPQRIGWLRREWWSRPGFLQQPRCGEYENVFLFSKRSKDASKFKSYTRMNFRQFEILLNLVQSRIQLGRCSNKRSVGVEKQLVIALRYLITGSDFVDLASTFNLGVSTIHKIIHRMTKIIHSVLSPIVLQYPNENDYWRIRHDFWTIWNMPNCIGAIDGKHIRVIAPPNSASAFYNYKGFFSVVLMAVCDARYCFTMAEVGQYGSVSDGGVFSDGDLGQKILHEEANIPNSTVMLPDTHLETYLFFVADQAFPLSKRIMRPYPGNNLGDNKLIFNYRLSRARGVIENTFGILVRRFKIFQGTIMMHDVDKINEVVMAAVCLHNFIQRGIGINDHEQENIPADGLNLQQPGPAQHAQFAVAQRETLMQFLINDITCPWQRNFIERGRNRDS